MADSICAIRETSRNSLALNRRKRRDEETDINRYLGNIMSTTPEAVTDITNKLKTKAVVTESELRTLKHAMIEDEQNIKVVLSTNGALRGIVRELSGHSADKQLEAAGCCGALARGAGERGAAAVARAAGPYLSALLDSLSSDLTEACITALCALCAAGAEPYAVVSAQGAAHKLLDAAARSSLVNVAIKPLLYCIFQLKDDLRPEHMDRIFYNLAQEHISTDIARLLFTLSCHERFSVQRLSETYVEKLLVNLYELTRTYFDCKNTEMLDYLIRFFANVNDEAVYRVILNHFIANNCCDSIKMLLATPYNGSLLWLLGNMYKCCGDSEFFKQFLE